MAGSRSNDVFVSIGEIIALLLIVFAANRCTPVPLEAVENIQNGGVHATATSHEKHSKIPPNRLAFNAVWRIGLGAANTRILEVTESCIVAQTDSHIWCVDRHTGTIISRIRAKLESLDYIADLQAVFRIDGRQFLFDVRTGRIGDKPIPGDGYQMGASTSNLSQRTINIGNRKDLVYTLRPKERTREELIVSCVLIDQSTGTPVATLDYDMPLCSLEKFGQWLYAGTADGKLLAIHSDRLLSPPGYNDDVTSLLWFSPLEYARIALETNPPDARVCINGQMIIQGDSQFIEVEPGLHTVTAEYGGYVTTGRTLFLEPGKEEQLHIELERKLDVIWNVPTSAHHPGALLSSPSAVVVSEDSGLRGLCPTTGQEKWSIACSSPSEVRILGNAGILIEKKTLCAFDVDDGSLLWQKKLTSPIRWIGSERGRLLTFDGESRLLCREIRDGDQIWRKRIEKNSDLALRQETLYAVSERGKVTARSSENGGAHWKVSAIRRSRLLGVDDSSIYLYAPRDRKLAALSSADGSIRIIATGVYDPHILPNGGIGYFRKWALSQGTMTLWKSHDSFNQVDCTIQLQPLDGQTTSVNVYESESCRLFATDTILISINADTHQIRWERAISPAGRIAIADSHCFLVEGSKISVLDTHSGNTAYIFQTDGEIYSFAISASGIVAATASAIVMICPTKNDSRTGGLNRIFQRSMQL